jgi:aminoglycoside phosphotransferase (APT) family kinase protein
MQRKGNMIAANLSTALTQSLRKMGLAERNEHPNYVALAGGVSSDIWRADLRLGAVCVKRALPKLRVQMDWSAPTERNQYEVAWFRVVGDIVPDAVPKVLGTDTARGFFVMEYLPPESYRLWRTELRDGRANTAIAGEVGRLLARIHAATSSRGDIAVMFPTDHIFHAIRLEPYFEATARKHPDLAGQLNRLVKTTAAVKHALVHGDVSPKNILVGPAGPVFLDAECAWHGDPAFDLAFCLNHLLLKCLWTPKSASDFLGCFDAMYNTYVGGVTWEPPAILEARAAALLPALFLARVDGKSPVEYLTQEADKDRVRRFGRLIIQNAPNRLVVIRRAWAKELGLGE